MPHFGALISALAAAAATAAAHFLLDRSIDQIAD